MVAVRGLVHSVHSNFGFEPRNAMLMNTGLDMAGYSGEAVPAMHRRMIEAMETIPAVTAVGLIDWAPLSNGSYHTTYIFTDDATDLKPGNAAVQPAVYIVSPNYFKAAGTALLSGRSFTNHD